MSGDTEKKYSSVFFEKDADGRPKGDNVFAVDDAKQVRKEGLTKRAYLLQLCTCIVCQSRSEVRGLKHSFRVAALAPRLSGQGRVSKKRKTLIVLLRATHSSLAI